MSEPYSWVYLCSNPRRLAITLRCLPKEPFIGLQRMNICYLSHLDPDDAGIVLYQVAQQWAPPWLNWATVDLSHYENRLPDAIHRIYWSTGKSRWSLGVKLLFPYAFECPYLYTDDDVVVSRDPLELMTNSFGSKGCFRFGWKKHDIAQQLFDAFDLPHGDIETAWGQYDARALDAGVWYQKHPDNWAGALDAFSYMPYLADLTTRNLELRCLDQRFVTMFGIKHGWDQVTIGNGFAPPKQVTRRMLERHPFFHYKSQSKEAWMTKLEEYLAANVVP
jgi:hypothetical protein